MGICKYCGQSAGLFRSAHAECKIQRDIAYHQFESECEQYLAGASNKTEILADQSIKRNYVASDEYRHVIIEVINRRVQNLSMSGTIAEEDAERIKQLAVANNVAPMDYRNAKDVLDKSYILRSLDAGAVPSVRVVGNNPIHLQKDETVIWNFAQTPLFEIKKHVRYVGGSRGISMRIARGVYYHVGSHRSHRIETEHLEKTAVGDLAICSKNIYFISAVKAVRIPCGKVVSVNMYRDGIEIFKDSANGRPFVFKVDDPHFAANILARLT